MFTKEAGQYFQYHSAYDKKNVFFVRYDWLLHDRITTSKVESRYIIIENRELSFFEILKEDQEKVNDSLVRKAPDDELFFKIDFTNVSLSYDQFNKLFTDPQRRDMVLDFFWDLYINKNFTHSMHHKELRLLFDADPYYGGVVAKLCYYKLVEGRHPYDKSKKLFHKDVKKGSVYGERLHSEKITALQSYWKYLLDEKHEMFFKYGMSSQKRNFFGFRDRENLWFFSLEDELKPLLMKSKKEKFDFPEKDDYIKASAKLLIKRYSLLDTLLYILPTHLGLISRYVLMALVALILIWGSWYYYEMNVNVPRDSQFTVQTDYLRSFLWMFVAVLPLAHLIGSVFSFKKSVSHRLWVLFPQIYLPRLLIALCSGWLVFMTAEETTKIFDVSGNEEHKVLLGLLLVLGGAMLVLMYNEIKSTAPSESSATLAWRSVKIFILGFIMSLSIGYLFAGKVFNILKKNNEAAMMESSALLLDSLQHKINNLEKNITKLTVHKERLNRLNIDPTDLKSINDIVKSKGVFIQPNASAGFQVDEGEIKVDEKKMTNLLIANLKHLTEDSVFSNIILFKFTHVHEDSMNTMVANLANMTQSTFRLKNYLDYKWKINKMILDEMELLQDSIFVLNESLAENRKPEEIEAKHFGDKTLYIKVDKKILNSEENNYIPFNQILNRAIIALFLGVFLQLVIQDKTITEPI